MSSSPLLCCSMKVRHVVIIRFESFTDFFSQLYSIIDLLDS